MGFQGVQTLHFFSINLFLDHYGSTWIRPLGKSDIKNTNKFKIVFRFTDDLAGVNGRGVFDKSCKELSSAF